MSIVRDFIRAIRITLILWVVTAVIYPAVILLVGQKFFPYQANGSLVQDLQGQVVGSALIGQPFTAERYFWSRPSSINYSTADPKNDKYHILRTGISGASNLAPSNPELLKQVQKRIDKLKQASVLPITADLVYTSGSGLDPHITPEAAMAQLNRVARIRGFSAEQINNLIIKHTRGRFLGIFGEPGVNVLNLNRDLDVAQAARE
ncbi:MAG: K(+)-transporting ATPase subunit C [Chroococcidiopsidaceae cyanobacterium CP_BM_ER_R8_30]|nr:K(+)-transporting ATPase subunit C [Chroococcidiopsidaceae cyanobacterium CP_BM_ER_R8_30]